MWDWIGPLVVAVAIVAAVVLLAFVIVLVFRWATPLFERVAEWDGDRWVRSAERKARRLDRRGE